jgi:hypothetical protein
VRFIVDEFPNQPKECLFSKWNREFGYVCILCNKECTLKEHLLKKCEYLLAGKLVKQE